MVARASRRPRSQDSASTGTSPCHRRTATDIDGRIRIDKVMMGRRSTDWMYIVTFVPTTGRARDREHVCAGLWDLEFRLKQIGLRDPEIKDALEDLERRRPVDILDVRLPQDRLDELRL